MKRTKKMEFNLKNIAMDNDIEKRMNREVLTKLYLFAANVLFRITDTNNSDNWNEEQL